MPKMQYEPTRVGQLIPEELQGGWAIDHAQLTQTTWNILIRALARAGLLTSRDYRSDKNAEPRSVIEIQLLFQLEIQDIKDLKHVGESRFNQLILEIKTLKQVRFAPKSSGTVRQIPLLKAFDSNLANTSNPYFVDEQSQIFNRMEDQIDSVESLTLEQTLLNWIVVAEDWRSKLRDEYQLEFSDDLFDDEKTSRRIQIFDLRLKGMTLDAIGFRFGLTRERIRQIVKQAFNQISHLAKFSNHNFESFIEEHLSLAKNLERSKKLERIQKIDKQCRELLEISPGLTYEELANLILCTVHEIREAVLPQTAKFIWSENLNRPTPKYSDEELLEALRLAEAFESPVTGPFFSELVSRGLIDAPGFQTVAKCFGTWKNACELAQINYVESVRPSYENKWTDNELLGWLIRFLLNKEFGKGVDEYDAWRIETMNDAPSGAHLRNTFGTWLDAKNMALLLMREEKISPRLIAD